MASNPMQKKAMNSFLLGFFSMLIIAALIGTIIFIVEKRKAEKNKVVVEQKPQAYVYVLAEDVKSGGDVTEDNVKLVKMDLDVIPSDAYGPSDIDGFYREVTNNNGEIEEVAKFKAKIDLMQNTIVSEKMLYDSDLLENSERIVEYNMLQLPVQLEPGDYVDVRFLLSNSQDFIVVSHKEVLDISENTIWLRLTELEINLMSSAIVEAYIAPATNLYVTKYVEAGLQTAQTATYVPSTETLVALTQNPNLQNQATADFANRYNTAIRGYIQSEINKVEDPQERIDNIAQDINTYRTQARDERELYLNGIR